MKIMSEEHVQIGQRMMIARKAKGLSQESLGGAIGVTFQQIQKYEKGANRVPFEKMTVIAGVLGVPVTQLLGISEDAGAGSALDKAVAFAASPCGLRIMRALSDVTSPRLLNSIADIVETVANAQRPDGEARAA